MGAQARVESDAESLSVLISKASERRLGGLSYGGEVSPEETYQYLKQHAGLLVDVRTIPEWQSVGMPDISSTKGAFAPVSWKIAPNMVLNTEFANQIAETGIDKSTPIFFLCRSGGRSLDAAVTMTQAGYTCCFNVTGGFEGGSDNIGWKAANLPCKQG